MSLLEKSLSRSMWACGGADGKEDIYPNFLYPYSHFTHLWCTHPEHRENQTSWLTNLYGWNDSCSPLYITRIFYVLKASSWSLWPWYSSAIWWWRQKTQPRHSLLGQPPSCPLVERSVTWNCFWGGWRENVLQAGIIFSVSFFVAVTFSKSPEPFLPSSDREGDEHMTECYSPLCHCICAPHMMWGSGIFGTWPLCVWSYVRKGENDEQLSHMRLCSWPHASPI